MEPPSKLTKPKKVRSERTVKKRTLAPVIKEDVYELYVQWSAIPKVLRGAPDEVIEGSGFDLAFAREMLEIKTKTEFAARFEVNKDTLTSWDKRIDIEHPLRIRMNQWMKRLTPNVMQSFYMKTVKHADAHRVRLWAEFVEEWREKGEPDPSTFMFQPQILVMAPDDRLAKAIQKRNEAKQLPNGG